MNASIKNRAPGDYYIFGPPFLQAGLQVLGLGRKPGQAWSQSQLVMLNEQTHLAPDRECGSAAPDITNSPSSSTGEFIGQRSHEPATNGKYPECAQGIRASCRPPANILITTERARPTGPAASIPRNPYYAGAAFAFVDVRSTRYPGRLGFGVAEASRPHAKFANSLVTKLLFVTHLRAKLLSHGWGVCGRVTLRID